MKKHEIFESNPDLKEVHMTSDGQSFFKESDAKNHAKTLQDKTVELVVNPSDYENLLDDLDEDQDDFSESDLGKKLIDGLKSFSADQFKNEAEGNFLNSDAPLDSIVADFSGEKVGQATNEPLTPITANADGSENILVEGIGGEIDLNNIPVLSVEETQAVINAASVEEVSADEKKSNAKKGK
ncbi:hypothetical protein CFS9_13190 [Flavobacterium sp. CFS9]|uniref:Uncharacterized protein n=1 Tax=Flavobacterium sp. CFS9 TaxID=3143118 RepID=A0AAT9GZN2_9FLAO